MKQARLKEVKTYDAITYVRFASPASNYNIPVIIFPWFVDIKAYFYERSKSQGWQTHNAIVHSTRRDTNP